MRWIWDLIFGGFALLNISPPPLSPSLGGN